MREFFRQSLGQKPWAKMSVNMLMDVQFSSDRPSKCQIIDFDSQNICISCDEEQFPRFSNLILYNKNFSCHFLLSTDLR